MQYPKAALPGSFYLYSICIPSYLSLHIYFHYLRKYSARRSKLPQRERTFRFNSPLPSSQLLRDFIFLCLISFATLKGNIIFQIFYTSVIFSFSLLFSKSLWLYYFYGYCLSLHYTFTFHHIFHFT